MCGIFAWVGGPDLKPDGELLQLAAAGAAARGPHSHGWVSTGQVPHRALGPMDPAQVPADVSGWILGHARLSTYGAVSDVAATHPIHLDGHYLVHNGNAPHAYRRHPGLPSDSVALATIYAEYRRQGLYPTDALMLTVADADQVAWAVAVMDSSGVLVASSSGLPIHVLDTGSGTYLSSGQLPGSTLLRPGVLLTIADDIATAVCCA
jgi:predicted glutamine amidotransferase